MKISEQNTRSTAFTALIISLLLHLSIVLYSLVQHKEMLSPQEKEDLLKRELAKPTEWVEIHAQTSPFAAPILFENPTDNNQNQHNDPSPPQEATIAEAIPEPMNEEKQTTTTTIQDSIIPTASIRPATLKSQVPRIQKPSPRKQQPVTTNQKKIPSLAQLTQGFLDHVKDEKKHSVTMLGKKEGTPTDEQLKYERYAQKLIYCVQNSFAINSDKFPNAAYMKGTLMVSLALNSDGSIRKLTLLQPSDNVQLDKFVLFVIQDASSSFPPVPHYLPQNPFIINHVLQINNREANNITIHRH